MSSQKVHRRPLASNRLLPDVLSGVRSWCIECRRLSPGKPEQSRTERNSAEQNRTEQNRTERNRAERNRTEQNRTEQNRAEQNRTKQSRTGNYVGAKTVPISLPCLNRSSLHETIQNQSLNLTFETPNYKLIVADFEARNIQNEYKDHSEDTQQ